MHCILRGSYTRPMLLASLNKDLNDVILIVIVIISTYTFIQYTYKYSVKFVFFYPQFVLSSFFM